MTTTTKVFVILVCLFAFIFTPMAIQFAARTHNWQKIATAQMNANQIIEAKRSSIEAVSSAQIANYQNMITKHLMRISDLEDELADAESKIVDMTAQVDQVARERDVCTASLERSTAQGQILASHNDELLNRVNTLTESEAELQALKALQNERINELMSNLLILRQQLEKRNQEMASCRQENEQLRGQLGLGTAGTFTSVSPTPNIQAANPVTSGPIVGRVKEVKGDLVRVDVGSATGVKRNMTLVVERGGDYVCDLSVTSEVSPNEAVAEVALVGERGLRPKPGDVVKDLTTFEGR